MLELDPMPTAVLVMSDSLASGVVRGAVEAGLRVPEDLSVIGFDGVPSAAFIDPPLTTVTQPIEEKGDMTARALLAALDPQDGGRTPADERPKRTILPTELLIRGTTGPPPD
jgi:LacI family transcriptional regulator